MKEKFKLTALEKHWVLYDIGNSAFILLVSTLLPIYFNALAGAGGLSESEYLAYWGYAGSISTILVAIIAPVCGTLSDRGGIKKSLFMVCLMMGAFGCAALGAAERVPRIEESVAVGRLELTFLFVPTDCSELTNPNSLSLIFSVRSPRKTVLMTGDAFPVTLQYCVDHRRGVLKADVLQLPHHGLCDTGNAEFYRLVNAHTLLIPISEAGDRAMRSGVYGEAVAANLTAEKLASVIHRAFEGTVCVEL